MDLLKGKEIMAWTFMGNTRMCQALRDYGDRISQIGLFSFKVRATGEIYESGVSIATSSTMRTYINKWSHIKWLLTVSNDGTNSIFAALRDNTDGAQDTFLTELVRLHCLAIKNLSASRLIVRQRSDLLKFDNAHKSLSDW